MSGFDLNLRAVASKPAAAGTLSSAFCSLLNCGRTSDSQSTWWVIDPRSSSAIGYWDLVASLALVFTAIVTPFEVGFLEPIPSTERWGDPLFLSNRFVDLVFISDMLLQFCMAYSINQEGGGRAWEFDAWRIARHYILSWWFVLDIFSIGTSAFDIVGGSDAKSLSGLRAVRVLRLLKLIRLMRGSRVFKRWEMRLSINYAYLSIFTTTISMVMFSHWFACVWGLQATFNPLNSWMGARDYCVPWGPATQSFERAVELLSTPGACPDGRTCGIGECETLSDGSEVCSGGMSCMPPGTTYAYSLYWSVMTITSVGYGDVVATPFNVSEQVVCTAMMLFGGMMWSQLIGACASLSLYLSTLPPLATCASLSLHLHPTSLSVPTARRLSDDSWQVHSAASRPRSRQARRSSETCSRSSTPLWPQTICLISCVSGSASTCTRAST